MVASFFNRLLKTVGPAKSDANLGSLDLKIAVAALLVEAGRRDDVFEPAEEEAIARILSERFDLSPEETQQVFASATDASKTSMQLFSFTRTIMKQMDEKQRAHLIEMLWEVAYADGVLDHQEDALIRKIAGLIYVSDFDRGAARRRVREKLGLGS